MSKTPEKPKKYAERLMAAFNFDEDDLEANQGGYLSQRQINRLKAVRNRSLSTFVLLALLFAFLAFFIVAAGFHPPTILPSVVTAFVVILAVYSISGTKPGAIIRDLSDNQAAVSEGRVDLLLSNAQYGSEYFLRVENVRFTVTQNAFLAFKNGDPYRIYYTPRSRKILSVEWLREDANLLDEDERFSLPLQGASAHEAAEIQEDQTSASTTSRA